MSDTVLSAAGVDGSPAPLDASQTIDLVKLWTEIRDLLKEQNQKLRIQNEHLRRLQILPTRQENETMESSTSSTQPAPHHLDSGNADVPQNAKDKGDLDSAKKDGNNAVTISASANRKAPESPKIRYHDIPRHFTPAEFLGWDFVRPESHEEPTSTLIAGAGWKYWRDIAPGSFDGATLGIGTSDYLPEWEVALKNGVWHHIDGEALGSNVNYSPDEKYFQDRRLVPYSLVPSLTARSWNTVNPPPLTNLRDCQAKLQRSLGNLYAAPPDWRLGLSFERDTLRLAAKDESLDRRLDQIRAVLSDLYQKGGRFRIVDIDHFSNFASYEYEDTSTSAAGHHGTEAHDPRVLAKPALTAEAATLRVPPATMILNKEKAGVPASAYTGWGTRWYRVISIRGLEHVPEQGHIENFRTEEDEEKHWLPFFRDGSELRFEPRGSVLTELFHLNLHCVRRIESINPFVSMWAPFHITWFKFDMRTPDRDVPATWRSGIWYGDCFAEGRRQIKEVAFTMGFFPSRAAEHGSKAEGDPIESWDGGPDLFYWTVLQLAPEYFPVIEKEMQIRWHGIPPLVPLGLIEEALRDAANCWIEIASDLDALLVNRESIFDPEMHDKLLFDDNSFSRSRLYFWAIDSLDTFILTIASTVQHWKHFYEARKEFFATAYRFHKEYMLKADQPWVYHELEHYFERVEIQASRLNEICNRMKLLHTQTKTLRDGLFNASAVIESRASTQLGENVKLLTYVSVFFLPLGFCAALWSIDYSYSMAAFAAVTAVLCVSTYLIVINLNGLVALARRSLTGLRGHLVSLMMKDADEDWVAIGVAFSQFKPERIDVTPSTWYFPLFVLSRLRQLSKGKAKVAVSGTKAEGAAAARAARRSTGDDV